MENVEIKHGYWIHEKVKDENTVNGYFYKRECKCSECGYEANMEKGKCPHCGAVMDQDPDDKV